MLRLPDGLRERIKAYADLQGRSMNAEIVRVLEVEFPEPDGIEDRIQAILGLTRVLQAGAKREDDLDRLVAELISTVREISDGTVQGVDDATRENISRQLARWEEENAENQYYQNTEGLDQIEIDALAAGLTKAKYPMDPAWRRRVLRERGMTDDEFEIYKEGYEAGLKARHEPPDERTDPGVPSSDDPFA